MNAPKAQVTIIKFMNIITTIIYHNLIVFNKDYIVHSSIYFHVLINSLISYMYHSLHVCNDHSLHIGFPMLAYDMT